MDKNKVSKVVGFVAGILTTLGVLGSAAVWAMDTRYITIGSFKQFVEEQNRQELLDRVEELTLKDQLGYASDYERALLEQLKQRLDQ